MGVADIAVLIVSAAGTRDRLIWCSARVSGILVDRRRSLGEDHTRMVCQLHQLLLELIPGGAKKSLSAAQAKALLATIRARDAVGKPADGWPPS
jgi:hypothetical protein